MNISISKYDVLWSYIGYILRFFSGVLLLPLLLRNLSSSELGIWYVFLSIGSLIQLLDLGFAPTITRNISYAFAGASVLKTEGLSINKLSGEPNIELICKLLNISQKIYLIISAIALVLLLTIGTVYICYITKNTDNNVIVVSWIFYSFGIFLNFFYSYWLAILNGIGKIKNSQQAVILSQVLYMSLAFVGLKFSFGLLAVVVSFLLSGFVLPFYCRYYFKRYINLSSLVLNKKEQMDLYKTVWYNAKKMGIVSLGSFLILQANTLVCSLFFELKTVASYGLTLQIINVLVSLSSVLFRTYLPVINEARVQNDIEKARTVMSKTFVFSWIIYFIGAFVILFLGEPVLEIIHSKTSLLDPKMIAFMLLYLFLENNHSNFATMATTKNEIPFVKSSIVSGFFVVVFALVNIIYFNLGIWSLFLAQFIVQLAYNNWYWPLYVMKDLNIDLKSIWYTGCKGIYIYLHKGGK